MSDRKLATPIEPLRGLPDDPLRPCNVDENGVCLGPMRRWRGLTWIGWLNYLVLRWFFVRLCYQSMPRFEGDTVGKITKHWLAFTPTWRW